ncbi:MAG TPA: alpha-L-fucosidase [Bryobacteraceae bacterium]|nr:alpha-L-fucosidase [Bryobacteraceae bacterium]
MNRVVILALLGAATLAAQNKPERLEWFRDQGFGLFIHWSVDSQLGVVISHSLVGASDDYTTRFFDDLPRSFNPRKFHPEDWAALARLAGVKYVVFTTKHHSGFAMWDTATTDFGIMHTPFRRDIFADVLAAFREQGIAPGVYFSPDDFHWLYANHVLVDRRRPEVAPASNPGLMALDQAQIRELLTKYGPISMIFLDGPPEGLREASWKLQPDIVVTRGAITTPEQNIPGVPLDGPWEACITMGTAWQYQPQNEHYKSGGELIALLVETRAKGGNLLLNVGPKPDGELPIEQEERLRELALWMFVNGEAIYDVRPWVISNEQNTWFTKKKDADTLYAVVKDHWRRGEWKEIVLHSVKATASTQVSVLGQNDRTLEYQEKVDPRTTFHQESDGLHIRAIRTQRLQDNSQWPNPAVLKISKAKPALTPPHVETGRVSREGANVSLTANLMALGDAPAVEVGFEYRSLKGLDVNERSGEWRQTPRQRMTAPGAFSGRVPAWAPGERYEFRAVVQHPVLTMYGEAKTVTLP